MKCKKERQILSFSFFFFSVLFCFLVGGLQARAISWTSENSNTLNWDNASSSCVSLGGSLPTFDEYIYAMNNQWAELGFLYSAAGGGYWEVGGPPDPSMRYAVFKPNSTSSVDHNSDWKINLHKYRCVFAGGSGIEARVDKRHKGEGAAK